MIAAYLRVSTDKQNIENQRQEILKYAGENNMTISKWVGESVSGMKSPRERNLGKIIRKLKRGDVLIVSEISRISRKMFEIYSVFNQCIDSGIEIHSVKEKYKIGDDIQSQFMGIAFGMSAQIERNLISLRTKEALSVKKANGIVLGRPKGSSKKQKMLQEKSGEIFRRLEAGDSLSAIARDFSIARGTLYAFLKKGPGSRPPENPEQSGEIL